MNPLDPAAIRTVLDALPADVRPLARGLDHLGVAVEDLDAAVVFYRDVLGLDLLYTETVESDRVEVAVFELGAGHLELLCPTGPESPVARFLQRRGPGLHHIALRTHDCASALRALEAMGIERIDAVPRPGAGGKRIGFVHPRATGGVLLELCERGEDSGA